VKYGDKPYDRVENSANFFELGGLIPNSTMKNRVKNPSIRRGGESSLNTASATKILKSYAETVKELYRRHELEDVHTLTVTHIYALIN